MGEAGGGGGEAHTFFFMGGRGGINILQHYRFDFWKGVFADTENQEARCTSNNVFVSYTINAWKSQKANYELKKKETALPPLTRNYISATGKYIHLVLLYWVLIINLAISPRCAKRESLWCYQALLIEASPLFLFRLHVCRETPSMDAQKIAERKLELKYYTIALFVFKLFFSFFNYAI